MQKKVLFIHPDLGIGGAERLVVDAALALINKEHTVCFVTTHHDTNHCFTETKNGTLPVIVVGDWIPRNIFGRFFALLAYIRMIYAAFYVVFFSDFNPDIVFCDIVSACIPVLKLRRTYVIYYCHFPDQLLSVSGNALKSIYRAPLNWIEEKTTKAADAVLVNSKFTRSVFKSTFKTISKCPDILYPSINTDFFDSQCSLTLKDVLNVNLPEDRFLFLSINRYERKKNISLAITSLSLLKSKLCESDWKRAYLVIVGGYDNRVVENVEYYDELIEKAKQCRPSVEDKVFFLKSPSDIKKLSLLTHCDCLLYTPSNEHFGIVPLEAMYSRKPVIAINSGGPTETVVSGETGFLCNPTEDEFSSAMAKCVANPHVTKAMGSAGRNHFEKHFSFKAFQEKLNTTIEAAITDCSSKNL